MEIQTGEKPFYSNLQRVVERKMPAVLPVQHLQGLIRSHQIHPEEMQYSGLSDLLDGKAPTDKIHKTDVQQTLTKNLPRINVLRTTEPVYEDYSTPGGHHYTETLLQTQLGDRRHDAGINDPNQYTEGHWSRTPNVTAHIRTKRFGGGEYDDDHVLHLDEIQSDWHQKGRAEGYKVPPPRGYDDANRTLANLHRVMQERWMERQNDRAGEPAGDPAEGTHEYISNRLASYGRTRRDDLAQMIKHQYGLTADELNQGADAHDLIRSTIGTGSVPDGPFKTNWQDLGLKQALYEAVQSGADSLTFNPGEHHSDRYTETHYFSHDPGAEMLHWHSSPDDSPGKLGAYRSTHVPADALHTYLNDDHLAGRLIQHPNQVIGQYAPHKLDLYGSIGEDGTVRHGIIGNKLNRYLRRFGTSVGVRELPRGRNEELENDWGHPDVEPNREEHFPVEEDPDNEGEYRIRDSRSEIQHPGDRWPEYYGDNFDDAHEAHRAADALHRYAHESWVKQNVPMPKVFHVPITEALERHVRAGQPLWGDVDASLKKAIILTIRKSFVGAHWRTNPNTGANEYVSPYVDSRVHTFKPPVQPQFSDNQAAAQPQEQQDAEPGQEPTEDQQEAQSAPAPQPAASVPQDSRESDGFDQWFGASKVRTKAGQPLPVWPLLDSRQASSGSDDPHHDTPLGHGYYFSTRQSAAVKTATTGDQSSVPTQYRVPVLDAAQQSAPEFGSAPPDPETAHQFLTHGDLRIIQPNRFHPLYQHLEALRDAAVSKEAQPCYLSIQNPCSTGKKLSTDQLQSVAANNPPLLSSIRAAVQQRTGEPNLGAVRVADLINGMTALGHDHQTGDLLRQLGYDGLTHQGTDGTVHVAFEPSQIKPAQPLIGSPVQKAITSTPLDGQFHSNLIKTLEHKMPNRASIEMVRGLTGYAAGSVPTEEQWYGGLHGFLEHHPAAQPIDKQALLSHLRTHAVPLQIQHRTETDTKFAPYYQPGGTHLQEHLLVLPSDLPTDPWAETHQRFSAHQGEHWDQNEAVAAHLRSSVRPVVGGGRTLHVDEVQSDIHQEGKRKGYDLPRQLVSTYPDVQDATRRDVDARQHVAEMKRQNQAGLVPDQHYFDAAQAAEAIRQQYVDTVRRYRGPVPDAPFKREWMGLMLKHALREAAQGDHDYLTIATAHHQADPTTRSLYGTPGYGWKQTSRGWMLRYKQQVGGGMTTKGPQDLETIAQEAGRNPLRQEEIKSLPHLHAFVQGYDKSDTKEEKAKIADRLWGLMNESPAGSHYPRLEGMRAFYGTVEPHSGAVQMGQVGKWLRDYTKRSGGELTTVAVPNQYGHFHVHTGTQWGPGFETEQEAAHHAQQIGSDRWTAEPSSVVQGIRMTPGLRSAMLQSQPLWGNPLPTKKAFRIVF